MCAEAAEIFAEELSSDASCGHGAVIAVKAPPFGEVVGEVERCRGWRRVLVVNEGDGCCGLRLL